MKPLRWSADKNVWLKRERGVSFEQIAVAIGSGGLLDILEHPQKNRYPGQQILVVEFADYVFLVPYVEQADCFFLKTVIPSRKATRDYLQRGVNDAQD